MWNGTVGAENTGVAQTAWHSFLKCYITTTCKNHSKPETHKWIWLSLPGFDVYLSPYHKIEFVQKALLVLRPTNPAGLDILARRPRPRETRCKTSCVKRFIEINVYLILLLDRVFEADPIRDHYPKANSQCHQP